MAAVNRMASFLATMRWEGGDRLSLDRRDPGDWTGGRVGVGVLKGTKWGVAASAHPHLDIANLSVDDALAIFVQGYWEPVGADELPQGYDHCTVDDAYNCGLGAASRRLRRVQTREAGQAVDKRIQAYSALRLSFLESLRSWRVFRVGWMRRVAGVEAEALKMAATAPADGARALAALTDASPAREITAQSVAAAANELDRAAAAARLSAALLAFATGAAAAFSPWVHAPASLAVPFLAISVIAFVWRLWDWRAHGARRDALGALADELAAPPGG